MKSDTNDMHVRMSLDPVCVCWWREGGDVSVHCVTTALATCATHRDIQELSHTHNSWRAPPA